MLVSLGHGTTLLCTIPKSKILGIDNFYMDCKLPSSKIIIFRKVTSNLDSFMFQLLIIGSISTSTGSIWKKKPTDLYIIEITEPIVKTDQEIVSFLCQQLLY